MELRFKKDELIEALEARRKWAVEHDRNAIKQHKTDEKKALTDFRESLRAALKWDYEKAKQFDSVVPRLQRPRCPMSAVAKLDKHIRLVAADRRTKYTIKSGGQTHVIYWLLTHDENEVADLCA